MRTICLRVTIAFLLYTVWIYSIFAEEQIFGEIFHKSRSLSLLLSNQLHTQEHKCQREVPRSAIFFQVTKNEVVRGNGSTIYYHRIEVCCEGYRRSAYDWQRCVPDCSDVSPNNCRNGFCRAPNQCECFDGFVPNDRGACVHTCPVGCQHGRCYLNGTCECNAGYSLDLATRTYCVPSCLQLCGNHQRCVAPGKCACAKGYKMAVELGCQPVCIPDCGYGKCVGPNQCECFPGYMKRPQRNVCEAECYIKCENGFCESRYKCQCRDGYKYDVNTTSCLPDCEDNCQNGVCIAPGVCKCFDGFELRNGNCEPICEGGCGYYGKCLEPKVCGCAITGQYCQLGSCDAIGRCLCPKGLMRFVDKCVNSLHLDSLVGTYEQREHYSTHLRREFEVLIGQTMQFESLL